ncbi:hypothetical protein CFN78_09960 [Amycolatopsis antarctica]|uniref:Lipoprotein n=1 Tax=Amycolatopsis antarctica TaxID=1854586 RepID=A0A263D3Y4_9PSEU|nr:hypothetical protein [Amycolatopsis antarctica]OZM73192.1 hypothetical protein CFN78_09960 [Amycolatopsis antarctica]
MAATAAAAMSGFVFSACGEEQVSPGNDQGQPTITAQQAKEQTERDVRELVTALPAGARLEKLHYDQGPCTDESGAGFGKRVQPNVSYWVRDLDPAQYNIHFDAMKAWLQGHGWIVRNDDRPSDMFLNAFRERDQFTMSLQANKKGGLTLGASSPCVWPEGTPEPEN